MVCTWCCGCEERLIKISLGVKTVVAGVVVVSRACDCGEENI